MLSKFKIFKIVKMYLLLIAGWLMFMSNPVFAAVPGGMATVSLEPSSAQLNVGDSFQSKIYFDTANIAVSGIALRLTYPYSGTTPEITVTSITINPIFAGSPDWVCPTNNTNISNNNVVIDIACANTSAAGYIATNTEFATIALRANKVPVNNPTIIRFDPSLSIITRKFDGRDILLIPTSKTTINVNGAAPTPTLTPTPLPTSTPTPTPELTLTPVPVNARLTIKANPRVMETEDVNVDVILNTNTKLLNSEIEVLYDPGMLILKSTGDNPDTNINTENGKIIIRTNNFYKVNREKIAALIFSPVTSGKTSVSISSYHLTASDGNSISLSKINNASVTIVSSKKLSTTIINSVLDFILGK